MINNFNNNINNNGPKVNECRFKHPLKFFTTTKLRSTGSDFFEGVNIRCEMCNQTINIANGYMTCEDMCDFDVHTHCYGDPNGGMNVDNN